MPVADLPLARAGELSRMLPDHTFLTETRIADGTEGQSEKLAVPLHASGR